MTLYSGHANYQIPVTLVECIMNTIWTTHFIKHPISWKDQSYWRSSRARASNLPLICKGDAAAWMPTLWSTFPCASLTSSELTPLCVLHTSVSKLFTPMYSERVLQRPVAVLVAHCSRQHTWHWTEPAEFTDSLTYRYWGCWDSSCSSKLVFRINHASELNRRNKQ